MSSPRVFAVSAADVEFFRGDPARAHVLAQQDDRLIAFSVTDTQVLTASHTINSSGPGRQTTVRADCSHPPYANGVPVPEPPPSFWET